MKQEIIEWKKSHWTLEPGATMSREESNPGLKSTLEKLISDGAKIITVIPTETGGGYSFQQIEGALIIIEK